MSRGPQMHAKPDKNSQASASAEAKTSIPAETVAPEGVPQPGAGDAAPDLSILLRKAEDEAAALKDAWLRAKAETDNVRKLAANDVAKAHKYAIERFAQELLTVKDALELALATPGATIE